MKNFLSMLFVTLIAGTSFVACGDDDDNSNGNGNESATTSGVENVQKLTLCP